MQLIEPQCTKLFNCKGGDADCDGDDDDDDLYMMMMMINR